MQRRQYSSSIFNFGFLNPVPASHRKWTCPIFILRLSGSTIVKWFRVFGKKIDGLCLLERRNVNGDSVSVNGSTMAERGCTTGRRRVFPTLHLDVSLKKARADRAFCSGGVGAPYFSLATIFAFFRPLPRGRSRRARVPRQEHLDWLAARVAVEHGDGHPPGGCLPEVVLVVVQPSGAW